MDEFILPNLAWERNKHKQARAMKTQMDKDRENWTSLISMAVGCLLEEKIVFMSEGLE